ncbi:hypothetical protein BVG19_g4428 [[Candida] boidinii]|nr:hypothetical protein BVG19_g4428 [[Candida] boidinii]OWB49860.1 hypothetical protein B5S27_g1405 [[Candida] boidinii]OWB82977.1 hypothetical protein B5S33_g1606 [[Candida] boidinii]
MSSANRNIPASNYHQFSHTNAERRASLVVGSIGRSITGGLFTASDFISKNKQSTIDTTLNDDDDDYDDEEAIEELESNISSSLPHNIYTPSIGAGSANIMSSANSPYNHIRTPSLPNLLDFPERRQSINQLLNEEAQLLARNKIQLKKSTNDILQYNSNNNTTATNATPSLLNSQRHPSYGSTNKSVNNISTPDFTKTDAEEIAESFDEAVRKGLIKTTWKFELEKLFISSLPLVITFLLENSFAVASVFSVGHIGATELAAVTLGSMSANITGFSFVQGLATALDTFLPQAYGANKLKLVGIIFQRCTALIITVMFFICLSWWLFAEKLLVSMLPDPESARLAAQYLKVVSFGMPGYILFETGKRFLQAQGIFHASTYVLFICAPLNAFMNYFFVWSKNFGIGYLGAPLSVAINYWLMASGLFLYTVTTNSEIKPLKCWDGLSINKSFKNWGKLFSLALPSVIMIEAEFLAFEILTLFSSYLGTTVLASQSLITTIASLSYQVPFGVSIASATRVANYLGAGIPHSAKISGDMTLVLTILVSSINFSLLAFGNHVIPTWFSNDEEVIELVSKILPFIAIIQIFDALNATSAGCLRGMALQKIGGYVNLFGYYVIGVPISLFLAFYADLSLFGLWIGTGIALAIIGVVQYYFIFRADWEKLSEEAIKRSNSD